jgi:hypothetical protein
VRSKIRAIGEIAVVDMFEHALERGLTDISTDAGLVQYDTAKGICNALILQDAATRNEVEPFRGFVISDAEECIAIRIS